MEDIVVRRAVPQDSERLAELYSELITRPTDVDALRRRLESDVPAILLVAETSGHDLVGTGYGVICPDTVGGCHPFMVVDNVVVHHAYRRRGIAHLLMTELETLAREAGCSLILLVSGAERTAAHRLYERLGYSVPVRGFRKYLSDHSPHS